MKLATTIGDFKKYASTWAEAVSLFKDTGFRYLDFDFYSSTIGSGSPFLSDDWMTHVAAAGEAAAQLGFTFVQAHSPQYNPLNPNQLNPNLNQDKHMTAINRAIEACGYLGIPNIVMHSGMSSDFPYPGGKKSYFAAARKFHESFFPMMEKYNVNVLIENIDHVNMEDNYYFHSGEDMVEFIEYCNHPLLHACWDVGHANIDKRDQYQDICKIGKHLRGVHIQDNFGEFDDHVAPFMGVLNLDAIMHGLIDTGYTGYFTFEALNLMPHEKTATHRKLKSPSISDNKLGSPSVELRRAAEKLLYEIGKYILTQYDCFEE